MKADSIDIKEIAPLITKGDAGESRGDEQKDKHFYGEDFSFPGLHPSIFLRGGS